jgi:hypothetical protein
MAGIKNLTFERYLELVEEQKGCCAICHRPTEQLVVDHLHETSVVRGLLCLNCNLILGHAGDSTEVLISAVKYLIVGFIEASKQ